MNKRSYLLLFLLFLPLILWRDYTPNNELRYLAIANDALDNGSLFAFYYNDEIYADKPPLYLWGVMLGKWILGHHAMWFLSLLSLLPALGTVAVMDSWCRKSMSEQARKAAGYALMTTGLFVGAGIVIRMDMLMTFFIVLAIRSFYRIYSGNYQQREHYLLPLYIFLGLFTKGPVGVLLPILTMVAFLGIKGEIKSFFKRYMGMTQWLILLGLFAAWIGAVALEGGMAYIDNLLVKQTVGRAVEGFHHKEPWWYYLVMVWPVIAPWSLFLGTAAVMSVIKGYMKDNLSQLFATVVVVTIFMLSLSSSKLTIYLVPMFPFLVYWAVMMCRRIEHRYLYWTVAVPAFPLALAAPIGTAAWYLHFKQNIPGDMPNDLPFFLLAGVWTLSIFAGASLLHLRHHDLFRGIKSLSIGIITTLFVASFDLHELNPYLGFKRLTTIAKNEASREMITNYAFYHFRSGQDMEVYLDQPVEKLTLEQVELLPAKGNTILFLRNKDIRRTPELREVMEFSEYRKVGNFTMVVFKPKMGPVM